MLLQHLLRLAPHPMLQLGRNVGIWCASAALLLTGACSRSQHRPGNPAANTAGAAQAGAVSQTAGANNATGEHLGTVRVIGTERRFVLIETRTFQPVTKLVDGQALVCRTAGAITSTLRVSHERRPPFVVADVAAGEPHVGDEVFIDVAPGHTVVPTAASSSLFPSANPAAAVPPPDFRANPSLPPSR